MNLIEQLAWPLAWAALLGIGIGFWLPHALSKKRVRQLQLDLQTLRDKHGQSKDRISLLNAALVSIKDEHQTALNLAKTRDRQTLELAEHLRIEKQVCADLTTQWKNVQRQLELSQEDVTAKVLQLESTQTQLATLEERQIELIEQSAGLSRQTIELDAQLNHARQRARTLAEQVIRLQRAYLEVRRLYEQAERREFRPKQAQAPTQSDPPPTRSHDDLKEIDGIGPVNERWLHGHGIFHFEQIANWGPQELAWVAQHLPTFGNRVYRENWVDQAARLRDIKGRTMGL